MVLKMTTPAKIIIIVTSLLLLTGCWNSKELDELGLVVALGVDKSEDGKYELTTQVINPSEIATDAPTARPPVSIYKSRGDSLFEAFRHMTEKSPRKMYLSQLRLLVIGKTLAEEGMMPSLDIFYRNHEFRTAFYVAIAKNTSPEELLSVLTPYEKIPANKLMRSLESVESNLGSSKAVTIDVLISQIRSKGQHPVLPGLLIDGDAEIGATRENVESIDAPTKLIINHLAVFKKDQLVGWLAKEASQGYNYITGNVKSTVITHPCKDEGVANVEIIRTQASKKANFKGGQPSISVELDVEGDVGELDCPLDLSKAESIQKINVQAEKEIKRLMETSVKTAQDEFGSDIFGFGNVINRTDPRYWKTVEKDWDNQFKDLKVDFQVKVKIRRKGNSTQPVSKES
ncbi:Ger(x)C family spore germination protein [Halobacillus litoralis]|uniref:Ger(X)C family spore germination protein n=1 Tax=Halobacillus litoralis TaxID=45668 RepID=A0A410MEJ4_9BACI|nr:Ger(x)C family spore germination protein [Halobacillus litoralis]QAS53117.1 Ger(x)C family spore germination protein [Halobacillus litoralis]